MKKEIWLIIILALVIIILIVVLMMPGPKGYPPAKNNPVQKLEDIQIISPKPNDTVSLPLEITGVVNGNGWVGFEGQVGHVDILFGDGSTVGSFPLKATSDWTSLPTSFEADITAPPWAEDCESVSPGGCATSGSANLIFHNENPSGLPEKDKTFSLPVTIK